MTTQDRYPLQWPVGYKRTKWRSVSKFRQTYDKAQQFLHDEVARLGGSNLIVSTNLPVRNDGGIYAAYMGKKIEDPGVAIFFRYKGKDITMCCDKYQAVWENIYALACGIESLRAMERHGVSEFMERAFTGFTALPEAPKSKEWWEILGYQQKPGTAVWDWEGVQSQYKSLARKLHPDAGGSTDEFQGLTAAFSEAKQYFNRV